MDNPTKEKLLASIQPGMKLNRDFFLKIYGYNIGTPGFKDIAIKVLEDVGCSKAEDYYMSIAERYEQEKDEQLKAVAKWLREKIDSDFENQIKKYEGSEKIRIREKRTQDLLQKSDRELLNLLQNQNLI